MVLQNLTSLPRPLNNTEAIKAFSSIGTPVSLYIAIIKFSSSALKTNAPTGGNTLLPCAM
jgi:hypothetical protein